MKTMKSQTIKSYQKWIDSADSAQVEFVDSVYLLAEERYDNGGSTIVECYTPEEILSRIENLEDAEMICDIFAEREADAKNEF